MRLIPVWIVLLVLVAIVPMSIAFAAKPQSDEQDSSKPASGKSARAAETSIAESLPETPLKIVQQATINAWKGLVSGKGSGTCTYKLKDKPDTKFDFEIAFDGDKFNFVMTNPTDANNYTPSSRLTVAVSDGSATLVRGFRDDLQHGERTAYIRSAEFLALQPMEFPPLIDLPRNTRTAFDPKGFDTFSIQTQKMPDGHLHGTYDLNKRVRGEFDARKACGYNVSRGEVFNKEGSRSGTIFTYEWKRDKNVWYVSAMTREHWQKGVVADRAELQYTEFTANPKLPPDLFSIRSLFLQSGCVLVDQRPGPSTTYTYNPRSPGKRNLTIAEEVNSLPRQ
jgi:hypothetical protein